MTTRRLYYDDAFEREFTARIMSCEVLPPDVSSGITSTVWGLILDRTAFYPTSGGQPNDLGKIADANVLDVRDEETRRVRAQIDRCDTRHGLDCNDRLTPRAPAGLARISAGLDPASYYLAQATRGGAVR